MTLKEFIDKNRAKINAGLDVNTLANIMENGLEGMKDLSAEDIGTFYLSYLLKIEHPIYWFRNNRAYAFVADETRRGIEDLVAYLLPEEYNNLNFEISNIFTQKKALALYLTKKYFSVSANPEKIHKQFFLLLRKGTV